MSTQWLIGISLMILTFGTQSEEPALTHYVIGIEDTRYLPQYDHDGEQLIGYARDFFDEFARQNQIKFDYKVYPINRLYHVYLVERAIDFKYPDDSSWRPELRASARVFYSQPCSEFIDGVMVLPTFKGRHLSQLRRLGMLRGFTPVEYLARIQQDQLEIDETGSISGLLQMGIRGRVDGVYLNVDVARYQLTHSLRRPDALVFDPGLPFYRGGYSLSTVKHPDRIEQLNQFMQHNSEWVLALKKRYNLGVESVTPP